MAKQKGTNPISGSIGNITYFYHPFYGFGARERYGPTKEQIENDPAYAEVKNNNTLMGKKSKAGSLIRRCFKGIEDNVADKRVNTWLVSIISTVFKETKLLADVMDIGDKHPMETLVVKRLKGFAFNETKLRSILFNPISVERQEERITVRVNSEMPVFAGCTHYNIVSSMGAFDFERELYEKDEPSSGLQPINTRKDFEFSHTMFEGYPVHMIVVSVMCYQEMNGMFYRLENKEHKSAEVMEVFVNGKKQVDTSTVADKQVAKNA